MDTVNLIQNLITSIGFPIVMCLILCWYIKNITEVHKNESDNFIKTLQENSDHITVVMDELKEVIAKLEERTSHSST